MIIGLSGYARSGKDEAAKALIEAGFIRLAFADKLREVLYALNPYVVDDTGYEHVNLQTVIDDYGWDGYKETPWGSEIRRLIQRLGTEAGRQTLWDSIWVDATMNQIIPGQNYVITDVRFPNEANAVKQAGGRVWRIERPGVGPANTHASEVSLDDWDFDIVVANDVTIEEYHNKIRAVANAQDIMNRLGMGIIDAKNIIVGQPRN
jgi:hypothetical protein